MSGHWDANIKLLYAVNDGQFFTIDMVPEGASFDVIADVEVGNQLMQFASGYDLTVVIRNLSKSTSMLTETIHEAVAPANTTWNKKIRVDFDSGWEADEGDICEAIASFKFSAGINEDYSIAQSQPFVVSEAQI